MFSGRNIAPWYIQIYIRIYQKSIVPVRFFLKVGPRPPVRPLLNIQTRFFRPSLARPLATGAPAPMRSTISRPHTVPGLAFCSRSEAFQAWAARLGANCLTPWTGPKNSARSLVLHTNFFWLVIGPDLGRRSASGFAVCKFRGRTVGALFVRVRGSVHGPPNPPNQPRGNVPAPLVWLERRLISSVHRTPVCLAPRMNYKPAFSAFVGVCPRGPIHAALRCPGVTLGCVWAFLPPSWSQGLARFIQSLARPMAVKLTPKGPLPPFG